ncbi:MAG: hypothetical protein ACKVQT_38555 [Burkholderiales bacterium]
MHPKKKCLMRSRIVAAILGVLLPLTAVNAFEQGRSSVSVMVSAGRQLDQNYAVLAGRYGRYFVPEFEASLTFEAWRGNDPAIYKLIPELRYVYSRGVPIKPYAGIFVSRTFYQGLSDRNSYGARLGAYATINPSAYLGMGVTYERIERCDTSVYRNCGQIYPEVGVHFLF